MDKKVSRFKVGEFSCFAMRDVDEWDNNILLIQTGQQNVLIDTGLGDSTFPPGLLLSRLREAQITPEQVGVIILSHADIDHMAGCVDKSGNPTFPHARCHLAREEWAYWETSLERMRPSSFFDEEFRGLVNTVPIKRLPQIGDRLELVETGVEIAPGFQVFAAPGHTPGMLVTAVTSGSEQLLCIADMIYGADLNGDVSDTSHRIGNPEWHAVVDVDPAQALVTRDRLFEQASRDGTLLMACHTPFPGLGHVLKDGAGWRWQSLV